MAGILYVTECTDVFQTSSGLVGITRTPFQAKQIISGTGTSAVFNKATRFVRLHSDSGYTTGVQFDFGNPNGPNPPAIVAASPRMAANQTEYFAVNGGTDAIAAAPSAQ